MLQVAGEGREPWPMCDRLCAIVLRILSKEVDLDQQQLRMQHCIEEAAEVGGLELDPVFPHE